MVAPLAGGPRRGVIVAGTLLAALALGWMAGSRLHSFVSPEPAAPALAQGVRALPAAVEPGSGAAADTADTGRRTRNKADVWSLATAGGRIAEREPAAARQVVSSAIPSATGARQDSSAPKPAPPAREDRTKLVSFPETRPTTVPGWVVRDIAGSAVVLEGPSGVFRVTTGDTVPGVGRVEFIVRWGTRWIVGTGKGLITTP
jgi:hypothetical protein